MTFSLFDMLLVVIVSQGVFLSIVLQLIPKRNKSANNILSAVLLIASIVCFGRVLTFKYQSFLIVRVGTIVDGTIYLFGPLLYLYFRRLLFEEDKAYRLSWKHYILLALFMSYALWTFTLAQEDFAINYRNGVFNTLFFLIELMGIFSLTYYVYRIARLRQKFIKNEQSQIAYNQSIEVYLKRVIIAVCIFVLLWMFSFVSYYGFNYYHPIFNYNVMWASVSIFMFFIGFYSLTQPEIFRVKIKLATKKPIKERMNEDSIKDLKTILRKTMVEEKYFLKSNLSLVMLSKKVNTTSNNLSWYLNKIEQKSFYQYINEFRVKEFIKKVESKEHKTKTVLALAFESGFNTKSTFNKSFRSIMNNTPADYIKNNTKDKSESVQLVD